MSDKKIKERVSEKKEQSLVKKALKHFGAVILLMYILFCIFGNGLYYAQSRIQELVISLGLIERYDASSSIRMSLEDMKKNSTKEQYEAWTETHDLESDNKDD